MSDPKINYLSYSKLKTLDSCSFLYYCKYILKIPERAHPAAAMGNICHDILEYLITEDQKTSVELYKREKIFAKDIEKVILKAFKDYKIDYNPETRDKVFNFIDNALAADFYLEGTELQKPEQDFDINDGFNIKGFIDKHGIIRKGKKIIVKIHDYKSSKEMFTQNELDNNNQALFYLLASTYLYKNLDIKNSEVSFIFIKFEENNAQKIKINKDALNGFKEYLRGMQKYIDNFTYDDAFSNFAASKDWPKPGEGFSGPLVCGRSSRPGELKKDGELKYHCPVKFPIDYYGIFDENGDVVKTAFEKKDLTPKEGEIIKKLKYKGCWYFNRGNYGSEFISSH